MKMALKNVDCLDLKWVELAQDSAQWRALKLATLKLRVLLPQILLVG
jgi:hypothetical protein